MQDNAFQDNSQKLRYKKTPGERIEFDFPASDWIHRTILIPLYDRKTPNRNARWPKTESNISKRRWRSCRCCRASISFSTEAAPSSTWARPRACASGSPPTSSIRASTAPRCASWCAASPKSDTSWWAAKATPCCWRTRSSRACSRVTTSCSRTTRPTPG